MLGFEYIKELYENDILVVFIMHVNILLLNNSIGKVTYLKKNNCVPNCSICELLIREAHEGSLMGHFGITKTLNILHDHFYWPK